MYATITIEEAQAKLKEVIDRLAPGEEVVITDNQQPVARLIANRSIGKPRPAHSAHLPFLGPRLPPD